MIRRRLWLLAPFILSGPAELAPALDGSPSAALPAAQEWVDEASCQSCHAEQTTDWLNSHHQLAMQPATEETELGNFDQQALTSAAETSSFLRRDGGLWINTLGADGKPANYQLDYTFVLRQ